MNVIFNGLADRPEVQQQPVLTIDVEAHVDTPE